MNGAHDCGGQMGHGPINAPREEPVFHSAWEGRMCTLMMAVGDVGGWNIDEDRSAAENMDPVKYLQTSYYEHWLHGLELLLKKYPPEKFVTPTRAADVPASVTTRAGYVREVPNAARFALGDKVRVKRLNPLTHTRAARYLRGNTGEVIRIHGAHVYPDLNVQGLGENPRWLYGVRFTSEALWGRANGSVVHADLWEPWLEPA
jgi:nitrile hydratase subunit beta